jgi:hypothetical protein
MFRFRNIYNYKIAKRREIFELLTFIQALIHELNDRLDWIYALQKNDFDHITYLFLIKNILKLLLMSNFEILTMNCIYKINRYNMFLMIISKQTTLHINFYVTFDFMKHEKTFNYVWIMQ